VISTVLPVIQADITGGAPELNPSFRYLARQCRSLGCYVIVRHNLTVMFQPGQDDLPQFFRDHKLEVISSLPTFWSNRQMLSAAEASSKNQLKPCTI
jgi:hypothetical protein